MKMPKNAKKYLEKELTNTKEELKYSKDKIYALKQSKT